MPCVDNLTMREEFNSRIKPKYRETHTPQCKKCMRFHPWGNSVMQVHHIKALIDGGTNDENNLITLCGSCHEEWHMVEGTIAFDDWMQRVPLYVYSAIGMVSDKQLKIDMFCQIDEMWPYVKEARMLSEPWNDKNKQYVIKNRSTWVDW